MDVEGIRTILDLVRQYELSEFELEVEGLKIKVRTSGGTHVVQTAGTADRAPLPAVAVQAGSAATGAPRPVAERASSEPGLPSGAELAIVTSPIVGTFYRAPAPGAPPFADVGARVKKGQVLCIIEAMKLMNEIESDCDGEIAKIYVENGKPVQFGDRLFAVKVA